MRPNRRFNPCGRCGSVHIRIYRINGAYVCTCKDCGKEGDPMPTIREAYRGWQGRIA